MAWENYNYFKDLKFLKENNNFFIDNQIIFLDLNNDMEIIRSNKDNYVIKNEGHPNELANKLIYEIVYTEIRNLIK